MCREAGRSAITVVVTVEGAGHAVTLRTACSKLIKKIIKNGRSGPCLPSSAGAEGRCEDSPVESPESGASACS